MRARTLARRRDRLRGGARRGHGADRRGVAVGRVRAGGVAGGPARPHRALRRRAARGGRASASTRCRTSRRRSTGPSSTTRPSPPARARRRAGRSTSSARAAAATRWSRAATSAGPTRRSSRRASRASGACRSATSVVGRARVGRGSSGSGCRRTTSRSRSPAPPRIYVDSRVPAVPAAARRHGAGLARRPVAADVTLAQARSVSFGLRDLRLVTRDGVRILIGQAAGIVIALLVAFSLVAVATAGIMLGASARSEVARRLPSIGVERAVGFSRGRSCARRRRGGALLAAPPPRSGCGVGALAMRGAAERLLAALNEIGPGLGLLGGSSRRGSRSWPSSRPPRRGRRGARRGSRSRPSSAEESSPSAAARGDSPARQSVHRRAHDWGQTPACATRARVGRGGGLATLGARLSTARRVRWAATVAVLGAASATLVLLLALASLLVALRDDPDGRQAVLAHRQPVAPVAAPTSSGSRGGGGGRADLGRGLRGVLARPAAAARRARARGRGLRAAAAGRGAAAAGRARRRSGSGWPTRSGCGRGRGSSSRCPAARRAGSG